jgi:hypothetical protein
VNYSDGNIYIDNSLGNVFISHGNVGTSVWNNKSIVNKSSGNIYINGVNGNDNICSNEYNESSIGICIVGNDRAILNESSATGSIYINQANVVNYAEVYAVNNYIGNIYINNSNITSTNSSAIVNNDGNVFICNSKITSKNYDLVNSSTGTGTINYSSDTIFTSGTNTPKISNPNGTINVDYTGTCLSN